MKRRDLILGSAGSAALLLPRFALSATPCPPPQVTVGGSSATTSCGVTGAGYSTNFPLNENPISEGGRWRNTGLDWTPVATSGGVAYSTQTRNEYDDSYAFLSGFGPDQQAQATIYKAGGYSPGASHEVEILLRCSDSPNNISYYECNLSHDGSYAEIVKLVGKIGNFQSLSLSVSNPIRPKSGDVFMARIKGNVIESFLNGVLMSRATDSSISSGQPGMAFFIRPGATARNYGFSSYSASAY